jgi:hypothetical protein
MVGDGRSGPVLDPASRSTASDGRRRPVLGLRGTSGAWAGGPRRRVQRVPARPQRTSGHGGQLWDRSAGSSDSTRPTPFRSAPSTTSSSRPTPPSRSASSSTIPRSPTSQPATASAHHNCASATCSKTAPSCCPTQPRPAHSAKRRPRLRHHLRHGHGRPRRHARHRQARGRSGVPLVLTNR